MRRRLARPGLLLCIALASVVGDRVGADECARTYTVGPVGATTPRIDGVLDENEWPVPGWEGELVFPWRDVPAPETSFIVHADGAALYFAFWVADEDIVVVDGPPDDESLVARGDRVELFFARDDKLRDYYTIEIDPEGRVLDYRARFYRPRRALESMGLNLPSGRRPLLAGVFRAEFSHRGGEAPHESWISWVRPWVPRPDFHVPSAFGCFAAP